MRLLTIVLFVLAILLVDGHSVRVGEEERRIWAPIALAILMVVLLARVPMLLRVRAGVLTSPAVAIFVAYLAWIGVTQHWSLAPAEGRNHIFVLWITLLAMLSLSEEPPHKTALVYIGWLVAAIAVSWAGVALGQSWVRGTEETWRLKGVMYHQQMLAIVCIAGVILATVWHLNRKRARAPTSGALLWTFVALAIVTLLATKGRSLTVFMVVTLFCIAFFHMRGAAKTWALIGAVVTGIGLYVAVDIILPLVSRGGEETLSGRLVVWEMTLDEIVKRPFGGFGFGVYQGYFYSLWNNWAPAHAHNLWLHTTFESGIIGSTIFTLFLAAIVVQGLRYQRITGALSYSLALAIFCILGGWTSVFAGVKLSTVYGLLLLMAIQERALARRAIGTAVDNTPVTSEPPMTVEASSASMVTGSNTPAPRIS